MPNSSTFASTHNQPSEFWLGIEQFNQGDYYACHDTLEAIWMEASTMEKGFYQGILQISVGLYHLTNLNWQGAAILLGEGSNRLDGYDNLHGGININQLIDQATDWLVALQTTGPENVQQLASILAGQSSESMEPPITNEQGKLLTVPTIQT